MKHRAAHRPTVARRAVVATVAVSAPLVPGALLAPAAHAETDWDALAKCESSGDWSINTGNGFSGGLQFTPSTWKAFGGSGKAEDASREQQIAVAEKVKAAQGMNAWPVCSKKTGNTSSSPNRGGVTTVSDTKSPTKKKAPAKKETKVAAARTEAPGTPGTYTVRDGDTLSSIAAAHGTTWRTVQDSNHSVITDPNMIFPGQTLTMA